MLTAADFDQLGFWEDATPEENITVYGMDFGTDYIMLTNDLGKTPLDAKKFIVVAAYDDADCFLWGVELKNFAALKELCAQYAPGSAETGINIPLFLINFRSCLVMILIIKYSSVLWMLQIKSILCI